MSKTRGRAQRIEIRAPIEDVWKAITEADEIIRWYAPEAEVSLSEGGRYWVSWGEGTAGTSRIESFERNRHLRLVHEGEGPAQLDEPMVEEYFLESMARSRCCASFSQASRQRPIGTISTKIPVAAGRFFLPGSGTTWSDISANRARTWIMRGRFRDRKRNRRSTSSIRRRSAT